MTMKSDCSPSHSARHILLIATADWDYPFWTNKQHVALSLSRLGHRVLYVDSLGLRPPRFERNDIKRIILRVRRALSPPRRINDNLWVCSPLLIPGATNYIARIINIVILSTLLRIWSLALKLNNDVLWTYNPFVLDLLPGAKSLFRQVVYHCVDNIAEQPCMPSNSLLISEQALCEKADIVFVTSRALYDRLRVFNKSTILYENVADICHFSQSRCSDVKLPVELINLPGPLLGFVGAISRYKLDLPLLLKLAKYRPDSQIILIGRVGEGDPNTNLSLFKDCSNIHILGPRPYSQLPSYLRAFDIALLPCPINSYTSSMFPMKFFEYIAAGIPVVSTNLPALANFHHYASFARDDEEFLHLIDKLLMFPRGCGPRASIPLTDLPSWCSYNARTQLMIADLNSALDYAILEAKQ